MPWTQSVRVNTSADANAKLSESGLKLKMNEYCSDGAVLNVTKLFEGNEEEFVLQIQYTERFKQLNEMVLASIMSDLTKEAVKIDVQPNGFGQT